MVDAQDVEPPPNVLSGDKPLENPKYDRLGYAPFAKHLAASIAKMTPTEGLVIALYGPWGSGKTTVLNFVLHYLEELPEADEPVIVRFNPWWFSGHEDLTIRFFGQLLARFKKWKSIANAMRSPLADLAELASPIPQAGPPAKVASRILRGGQKDVLKLKAEVSDALKRQKRWVLVVMDDIDRLTSDEIRQLFRLVKAVADFPNTVYFLAFEKKIAIEALEAEQGIPGEAYLEKIVQVPFELPLPDKASLRRLLFEKLDDVVLADTPEEQFDRTYWSNVYLEGIDHFIDTPRDIVRLVNTLSVTYANPDVKGNVNPVDFIAIEALRVFCSPVYDAIRKNPDVFAGHTVTDRLTATIAGVMEQGALQPFLDPMISSIKEEDREPVKQLLKRLFPKTQSIWGVMKVHYGSESLATWRKQNRVCSPDVFPIYFRLAMPEGSISSAEMQAMLALAGDAKAFGARLIELASQHRPDGMTRVRAFLERLEDYTGEDVPIGDIPSVIQALFDVGDDLLRPEDERRGMFDFGNDIRIGRLVFQLLRRLDGEKRFEVLREAISEGKAVKTIVVEVAVFGQEHGKYGTTETHSAEERLVTAQQLETLEGLALGKIRDAAQRDALLGEPGLPDILYRWRDWAGDQEVKEWVQRVIEKDEGLVVLLERFLQKVSIQYASDVVGRSSHRLDPKSLEPFLEPSQIIDRLRNLTGSDWLTGDQRTAVEEFIRAYEMREQGIDPDSPLARNWQP